MNYSEVSDIPKLPPRTADSHKVDYGRALLIGGSAGMTGAISLAGMAALRSGAGLVNLAIPESCLSVVASFNPCYMTWPLACDRHGRISAAALDRIEEVAKPATAIGCGPGLGRSDDLVEVTQWLYCRPPQPMVFDADALFALAQLSEFPEAAGPRILTPHPGEFATLTGGKIDSADERIDRAVAAARELRAIIVLKGHGTVVTDGEQVYINESGNPGMATGGSGDVLTGVITALLCQGLDAFSAAQLGVYLHGWAGDKAEECVGIVSLTARDLIDYLPAVFCEHETGVRQV
jgi:NAD(P)H-hydrate epimerase